MTQKIITRMKNPITCNVTAIRSNNGNFPMKTVLKTIEMIVKAIVIKAACQR